MSTSLPLICTGPLAEKSKVDPLISTVPSERITKLALPTLIYNSSPAVMLYFLPTMALLDKPTCVDCAKATLVFIAPPTVV